MAKDILTELEDWLVGKDVGSDVTLYFLATLAKEIRTLREQVEVAKRESELPTPDQVDKFEASAKFALRVLDKLAEVAVSGESASSGYLRQQCGLSADEWHGNGQLLASLLCFAAEKGFLGWHAANMVGAGDVQAVSGDEGGGDGRKS